MTDITSLEIDFFPVGENSKSGDAITLRFGKVENDKWINQTIFVIDGGNSDSGDAIVKHIKEVYNSNFVDRVILTHPDGDHASGLRNVIEGLEIGKIWMHCPWNHWNDLKSSIVDGRITKKSYKKRVQEAYQYAYDIEQLAKQKKIDIFKPNQGSFYHKGDDKYLTVLGPDEELYLRMIQNSEKTPEMDLSESFKKAFSSKDKEIAYEDMTYETEHLADNDEETSPENNMSLVILLTVADTKVLFTGDAGTEGMFKAIKYANSNKISLKDLNVFQVPHHGSKHNLSKGILKYINAQFGIISCAKEGEPSHPSKIVTNSLIRRNIPPYSTKGILLNYHKGIVPSRNLGPVSPIPFYNHVEI